MRLYTRRGFNWVSRYPRIVEALRSLRVRSIVIDGEAVWCATPTTAMTHIAVQEALNGKPVEWMEHVSDEQYRK